MRCSASVPRSAARALVVPPFVRFERRDDPIGYGARLPCLGGDAPPALGEELVAVVGSRRTGPGPDEPLAVALQRVHVVDPFALDRVIASTGARPSHQLGEELARAPSPRRVSPYQNAEDANRCCFARVSAT